MEQHLHVLSSSLFFFTINIYVMTSQFHACFSTKCPSHAVNEEKSNKSNAISKLKEHQDSHRNKSEQNKPDILDSRFQWPKKKKLISLDMYRKRNACDNSSTSNNMPCSSYHWNQ
ncbi:hypothetical protein ACJBU6_04728 [Exserohilum turcicum]